jgi:hypothetical protein
VLVVRRAASQTGARRADRDLRAGQMPNVDGACVPVGAPVLADAPVCPSGQLALPGESACHPIAACPSSMFPKGTVYVDINAATTDADGTLDHPYPRIQQAIDAASAGAEIAISAGKYAENLRVGKALTLRGVCADKVEIAGTATYSIDITGDVTVEGVSVTGSEVGVGIASGKVALTNVRIHDTNDRGIDLEDFSGPASLTMRGCIIERAREIGVFASGATLTIENSVIRGTRLLPGGKWGQGINVRGGEKTGVPSNLTLRKSIVEDHTVFCVAVNDSNATVEDSILRNTHRTEASPAAGFTSQKVEGMINPTVSIRRTRVEAHEGIGIDAAHSKATIADVLIRTIGDDEAGGIVMDNGQGSLERITVEDIAGNGLTLRGEVATVSSVWLRDLRRGRTDNNGGGIILEPRDDDRGDAKLDHILIEGPSAGGLINYGSVVVANDIVVRDAKPGIDGTLGDGITNLSILYEGGRVDLGRMTVSRAILVNNARAGLVAFGSNTTISDSILCNTINIDVERTIAILEGKPFDRDFVLQDGGGNRCGCATATSCTALSTGLVPVAR